MKSFSLIKTIWIITSLLVFIAAGWGIMNPQFLYSRVMPAGLIPPSIAQDTLSCIVTLVTMGIILTTKSTDTKKQIILIGLMGSFAYLYAIFSIERIYNPLYIVYLAIVGLGLYGIPFTIHSLDSAKWIVPFGYRYASALFSTSIAILFCFLWISALIPSMMTGKKIELYYSIYIIDLVWIMPGFMITTILSWLKKPIGYLLSPAMYILGIFVIFPLGLGELAKPFYGYPMDTKSMIMSFTLSGCFLLFSIMGLMSLKKETK